MKDSLERLQQSYMLEVVSHEEDVDRVAASLRETEESVEKDLDVN